MTGWELAALGSCHDPEIFRIIRESEKRKDNRGNGYDFCMCADDEDDDDDTD